MKISVIQKFKINKDSNAIKLRINHSWFCWIVNFYNHDGEPEKNHKLFRSIRKNIPKSEWDSVCIFGDFNIDITWESPKFKTLRNLAKLQQMTIESPCQATHGKSIIDFMICGNRWQLEKKQVFPGPSSDHKSIHWTLTLSTPKKVIPIKILDRKATEQNTANAIESRTVTNASTFLREMKSIREKHGIPTKVLEFKHNTKADELMEIIFKLDSPEEINNFIKDSWTKK